MSDNKFGQSRYSGGSNFKPRNHFKLKDGDNIYRILPAMGDLADKGIWSVYYNVIFGFKNSEGKHRPFQSPLVTNKKTKEVEIPCAATALINGLKSQMKAFKDAGNLEKAAELAKIVGDYPVMGVFSINNDHYMNVIDQQGNVGTLELGHKAKLALDTERTRIRDTEGFDPLSPDNGRYFNLRRSGKGRETVVQVTVVKEKMKVENVGNVERDIVHVIDEALGERLLTKKDGKWVYREASNLDALYKTPSSAEVELIVKLVDINTGKSTGIDQVFPSTKKAESVTEQSAPVNTAPAYNTVAHTVGTAGQTAQVVAPVVQQAQQAETVVKPTVSVVEEAKKASEAPKTQTMSQKVQSMTPDEFMAQFGIKV